MPLRARASEIRAAGRTRGWYTDTAIASGIGLNQAHVYRVLRGDVPGAKFIEAALRAFGGPTAFHGLFEMVDEDDREPEPVGVS